MKKEEKEEKTAGFHVVDPKPPVIRSGRLENRIRNEIR